MPVPSATGSQLHCSTRTLDGSLSISVGAQQHRGRAPYRHIGRRRPGRQLGALGRGRLGRHLGKRRHNNRRTCRTTNGATSGTVMLRRTTHDVLRVHALRLGQQAVVGVQLLELGVHEGEVRVGAVGTMCAHATLQRTHVLQIRAVGVEVLHLGADFGGRRRTVGRAELVAAGKRVPHLARAAKPDGRVGRKIIPIAVAVLAVDAPHPPHAPVRR
mmetsp:Transcript_13254/g.41512  ORF Transcript_13254/g.41512 Transcript_13254/m.41512 type:complete len:215 (-) Transcript_13254:881-1525(-)